MTMTTEISEWFDNGKLSKNNYTHMIIVCDTFSYEDYPVYVKPQDNINNIVDAYKKNFKQNMQKILEIYSFSLEKKIQLKPGLTYNI